ncbi:DUF6541 family protein [Pseudonocardia sp. RS010]|uniref:DUF6541 family protein n=1 Tax=Pseudonocardia sp. RS010 TaxID=3385979 RepID=UPI0039A02218
MGGGAGSWLQAVPVVLVAAGWLVVPGLLVTYAARLRGVTAWALAPLVGVGSAAVAGVLAGAAGIRWSAVVAVLPAAALAALTLLVRLGVRRVRPSSGPSTESDGRRPVAGALAGLLGAALLTLVTARLGMGTPDALSQTYDAVFHDNAVAQILATGNASSLAVGTLNNPGAASAFYPAAWHDLVSLVVLTTGASIPLASNALAIAVAALAWPLCCLALVRRVAGCSATAALATPLVAVGFIAFPWALMTFGVLWPNLLGTALVPAELALVTVLFRVGRDDAALTRPAALLLLVVGAVALGLAHPNAVLGLGVLALPVLLWALVRGVLTIGRGGRWWLSLVILGVVAAAAVGIGAFLATSPLFDGVRAFDWPAYQRPTQAAGEVLLNATNRQDAAWAISAFVVVGIVVAAGRTVSSWLVPAHLLAAGLFVLASGLETPTAALLTGFWYNDPYRLAALVPVTGVPLAVLGILWCGSALGAVRLRGGDPSAPAGWSDVATTTRSRLRRSTVGTVVVLTLLVLASSGLYVRDHADFLRETYAPTGALELVDPAERAFFARVAALVPPGSVVAQNPWSGSALLWALDGDRVLFPHMVGSWSADQLLLAARLRDAATDPDVCAAAGRLHVDHLLVGRPDFWPWDKRSADYPGLAAPDTGFRLVAADGRGNQLYRLTACGAG